MEHVTIMALPRAARLAGAAATAPAVIKLALRTVRSCDSAKPSVVSSHGTTRRRRRCVPAAQQDHGRDFSTRNWRLHASNNGPSREESSTTGLSATVEKATNDSESAQNSNNNVQRFGSSEASCDDGSSFLAVESVLENEGGKSVEDYKLRAHIFAESAVFFAALKDRNTDHNNRSAMQ